MSVTVQIDDVRFRDALNSLASLGLDMGRVLRVESRKLLKELIAKTPPDDRAQGENAIREDIFGGRKVNLGGGNIISTVGIFWIIGENQRATNSSDVVKVFPTKDGRNVIGVENHYWKPDATIDEMAEVHQAARSKATGRVSIAGSMTHSVGRWRFVDRMTVKKSAARRYFNHVKKNVGKLKGGWGVSAARVGMNLPGWVARHANSNQGYCVDNLGRGESPFIIIGNTSNGAVKHTANAARRAVHNRIESIKTNVRRMIKYGPGKAGDYGYASS